MSLKWLIVIFCLICSNSLAQTNLTKSATNELKRLDENLKGYYYEGKQTVLKGPTTDYLLEKVAQPIEVTKETRRANCAGLAVLVKKEAEKEGLKAKYKYEPNHVSVRVETKNGAAFRYSNGKNTGRTW